jgi:hypothetical protein
MVPAEDQVHVGFEFEFSPVTEHETDVPYLFVVVGMVISIIDSL